MTAMNEYFKGLRQSILTEINTSVIGVVDKVNDDRYDVSVSGLPFLINLPSLGIKYKDDEDIERSLDMIIERGDKVLVVFNNNDLSNGVVVGVVK